MKIHKTQIYDLSFTKTNQKQRLTPLIKKPQTIFLCISISLPVLTLVVSNTATTWQHWAVLGTFLEKLAQNFLHLI